MEISSKQVENAEPQDLRHYKAYAFVRQNPGLTELKVADLPTCSLL